MASKKLASSASVVKGDQLGGCFYSKVLSTSTDSTLYNRSTGKLVDTFVSAIKKYVTGTGEDDFETLTANLDYVSDISDEGITASVETDEASFQNMDGNTVLRQMTSRDESITLSMIDTTADALKMYYGDSNVEVSGNVMTVHHNNGNDEERIGIFLLALSDGRRMVRVLPRYKITEQGDESLLNSELWAHEITLGLMTDANNDTAIDYITESAVAGASVLKGDGVKVNVEG